MFCHHVIAVFEHLRLDEIPIKYILQRYTKDAVTNPDFNRKDYKTTSSEGSSLQYKRIILYSQAMKFINRGCSSDRNFDIAVATFIEGISRMDTEEANTNSNEQSPRQEHDMNSNERSYHQEDVGPDTGSGGNDEDHKTENSGTFANIRAPFVAKTKGSKSSDSVHKKRKSKPAAPARPEPELDENGKPKGKILCGNCNKIAGHNARTCKKREMARQLLETHKKMYGTKASTANVKICIKNLLARQDNSQTEDEEILDTDEEEDYEDETDDEPEKSEEEETDISEEEEAYTQSDSQADVGEKEETYKQTSTQINLESMNKKEGRRKCGLCKKEKAGH